MRRSRSSVIVVVVILIAFATVVISSTLSAGEPEATHRMPDGAVMEGERMP